MPKEYVEPAPPEPTPDPNADKQKDLDDLIAKQQEQDAKREIERAEQQASYDERMANLEGILKDQFSRKTPPPDKPVDSPAPITDEDFMTPGDARQAATRLAKEAALDVGQQLDANYRGTMTTLLEDQFESKLEAMATRKYWKYVEKDINAAIQANPNLKLAPKALEVLYNAAVGQKAEEIHEQERADETVDATETLQTPARPRLSAPRSRPAPPTGPTPRDDEEVVLSTDAEEVRAKFAPFIKHMSKGKVELSPERFARGLRERASRPDIPDYKEEG